MTGICCQVTPPFDYSERVMVINRLQLGMGAIKKRRFCRFFAAAEKHFFACWCGKFDWRHASVFMTTVAKWLVCAFSKRPSKIIFTFFNFIHWRFCAITGSFKSFIFDFLWTLCHVVTHEPHQTLFPKKKMEQATGVEPDTGRALGSARSTNELHPQSAHAVHFHNRQQAENIPARIQCWAIYLVTAKISALHHQYQPMPAKPNIGCISVWFCS